MNDILDRRQDRLHPRRRLRPIASGEAPLAQALWLPLPLVALAALCCAFLAAGLRAGPGRLSRDDVALFGGREKPCDRGCAPARTALSAAVVAGSFATGNVVSHWLLAFALTLFLSLALCKRVSELSVWRSIDHDGAPGRKYRAEDIPVLQMMAVSSGFPGVPHYGAVYPES